MSIPAIGAVSPSSARVGERVYISGQYIGVPSKIELRLPNGDIIVVGNYGHEETPGIAAPLDQIDFAIPSIGSGQDSRTVDILIYSDNAIDPLVWAGFRITQAQTQASYSTYYDQPFSSKPKPSDYTNLGMFYQDPDSNTIAPDDKGSLNSAVSGADTALQAKLSSNLYGFRFLFNPTTFGYGANVNNSVDWSIPNTNNAVVVGTGIGGQISLGILLDRVADMYTMKNKRPSDVMGPPHYPYDLTPEQCENILRRGTEYDLEYLFRVVNGKPAPTTMLGYNGSSNFKLESSNLGYIAGTPFIFKVHDALRFRVMLTTLQVSHDIFTKDMVPIRTYVQIGLERLPDFPPDKSQNLDKYTDIAMGVKSTSTNSGVYQP
jgi:hypothetical protein